MAVRKDTKKGETMSHNRSKYEKEFKVKLCKNIISGKTKVGQASKEYNIQRSTIPRWIAEYNKYKNQAFTGHGNRLPKEVEIEHLKQRIKQLEMENDILKKFDEFVKTKK